MHIFVKLLKKYIYTHTKTPSEHILINGTTVILNYMRICDTLTKLNF